MCPYRKQITFRSLHILLTRHLSALKRTVSFFSLFSSGTLSRNESQESDFELFDFRPALGENVGYFAKKKNTTSLLLQLFCEQDDDLTGQSTRPNQNPA